MEKSWTGWHFWQPFNKEWHGTAFKILGMFIIFHNYFFKQIRDWFLVFLLTNQRLILKQRFTSPSSVSSFFTICPETWDSKRWVCLKNLKVYRIKKNTFCYIKNRPHLLNGLVNNLRHELQKDLNAFIVFIISYLILSFYTQVCIWWKIQSFQMKTLGKGWKQNRGSTKKYICQIVPLFLNFCIMYRVFF